MRGGSFFIYWLSLVDTFLGQRLIINPATHSTKRINKKGKGKFKNHFSGLTVFTKD